MRHLVRDVSRVSTLFFSFTAGVAEKFLAGGGVSMFGGKTSPQKVPG